ncbi:four-carbon acid sugar kinase family protein [Terrihabitans rhizophilus]|uniref:Four-carbon acid sugar kinase family protein n=1 Tax=Terrihabitans rhizophilus TaxID=3092662 RepID=A0ABU4RN04_9HYPH|nr:four-carbon acid sugar kinase family protein [Terrihabitans sp. PJ23]MDX6806209.1 four-carbon acid sugar kinase family protein [Terrihabitans sp. PJ23]
MTNPAPEADWLLSFYGDDYTGSSAVMEVLTFAGVPTVLFLGLPTPEQIARFSGYRALGIAGMARARSPRWMEDHLPAAFEMMASLGAPIAHYKVCSTFDSAPEMGSIGKAIEIAAPPLGGSWHPMVVGAPALARYQAFGNLFAAIDGVGHRLDRHPVMSRHPVTPMRESDLRLHLADQTRMPVGLIDLAEMKGGRADMALRREQDAGRALISLDVIDQETLQEVGRLIWEHRGERLFAVGSQGVEYALVAHWRAAGLLPEAAAGVAAIGAERLAVVSGSCSPITAVQIDRALLAGFAGIRLDASRAVDARAWNGELDLATEQALGALQDGRDPLVFTASGPDDPAIPALGAAIAASGDDTGEINTRIGDGLGTVLDRVLRTAKLKRAVISGGDTSGQAGMALGIYAVTALAPLVPGSPLCRAHAEGDHDGLEIAFKGGQMGSPSFFLDARDGGQKA